jgi:hypothetical protein
MFDYMTYVQSYLEVGAVKPLIYIAGPYTNGDQKENIFVALKIGDHVYKTGAIPYVPHLSHYWAMSTIDGLNRTYAEWMEICLNVVNRCDALIRLDGFSNGSDMEVKYAKSIPIPVFKENEIDLVEAFIKEFDNKNKGANQ